VNKAWQKATQMGDVETVRAMFAIAEHVNSRDDHGQTALMNAARQGHVDLVRVLVAEGADLDVRAKYGLTALMLAITNDRRDVARILIDAGADLSVTGTGAPGFAGKTAQDLARGRGQEEVVAALEAATHRIDRPSQ